MFGAGASARTDVINHDFCGPSQWGAVQYQTGASDGTANVSRNTVKTGALIGVFLGGLTAGASVTNSDFTGYVTSLGAGFGGGTVTRNWWGNVAGPQNVLLGTDPAAYTPWATAPIANGAGRLCNGM